MCHPALIADHHGRRTLFRNKEMSQPVAGSLLLTISFMFYPFFLKTKTALKAFLATRASPS